MLGIVQLVMCVVLVGEEPASWELFPPYQPPVAVTPLKI